MFEVKNIEDTNLAENPVIAQMSKYNHEQLLFCNDNATGLKAIIAVHNTVLGPALGGTRMWPYATETEALTDVLRLSRGMSYKNSISGLNPDDIEGKKKDVICGMISELLSNMKSRTDLKGKSLLDIYQKDPAMWDKGESGGGWYLGHLRKMASRYFGMDPEIAKQALETLNKHKW